MGPDLPEGWGFVAFIEEIANGFTGTNNNPKIVLRDIRTVTDAWDCYAYQKENCLTCRTVSEYHLLYNKRLSKGLLATTHDLLKRSKALKAKWVLGEDVTQEELDGVEFLDEEPPPKRRRGRPRKLPSQGMNTLSLILDDPLMVAKAKSKSPIYISSDSEIPETPPDQLTGVPTLVESRIEQDPHYSSDDSDFLAGIVNFWNIADWKLAGSVLYSVSPVTPGHFNVNRIPEMGLDTPETLKTLKRLNSQRIEIHG